MAIIGGASGSETKKHGLSQCLALPSNSSIAPCAQLQAPWERDSAAGRWPEEMAQAQRARWLRPSPLEASTRDMLANPSEHTMLRKTQDYHCVFSSPANGASIPVMNRVSCTRAICATLAGLRRKYPDLCKNRGQKVLSRIPTLFLALICQYLVSAEPLQAKRPSWSSRATSRNRAWPAIGRLRRPEWGVPVPARAS